LGSDGELELKLAKAAYAEAEQIKKAAEQDRAAAEYERGQIEHAKRLIEQTEKSVAAREQRLAQLNEAELVAREQAVEQKLAEAKALLAEYRNDKHEAAKYLLASRDREAAAARRA
jgi:hypothetical protein